MGEIPTVMVITRNDDAEPQQPRKLALDEDLKLLSTSSHGPFHTPSTHEDVPTGDTLSSDLRTDHPEELPAERSPLMRQRLPSAGSDNPFRFVDSFSRTSQGLLKVRVNGEVQGLSDYIAGLKAVWPPSPTTVGISGTC
jgi:hypothetical protein